MLKREFSDSFRQLIMIGCLLVLVPALALIDGLVWGSGTDYLNVFIITLGILVYVLANRFGIELFRREEEDDAFEYLMSLPVSRWGIYGKKILPRLLLILPLILIYDLLVIWRGPIPLGSLELSGFFLFHPGYFPLLVLLVLGFFSVVALFGRNNFALLVSLAALVVSGLLGSAFRELILSSTTGELDLQRVNGNAYGAAGLLVVLAFGICFILVFRRFDARGQRHFGRKLALYLLIPLVLLTLAAFGILLVVHPAPLTLEPVTRQTPAIARGSGIVIGVLM